MIDCVGSIPRWGRVGGWPRVPTAPTGVERGGQPPAQRDGSLTTEDSAPAPRGLPPSCPARRSTGARDQCAQHRSTRGSTVGQRASARHALRSADTASALHETPATSTTTVGRPTSRAHLDDDHGRPAGDSERLRAEPSPQRENQHREASRQSRCHRPPCVKGEAHGRVRPTVTRAGRIRGGFTWFKQFLGHPRFGGGALGAHREVRCEGIRPPMP